MLFGSVVAKFEIDFALIFDPKIDEKMFQNEWNIVQEIDQEREPNS